MELWELAAREQIRETIGRYAHCADRGRFAELAELFAPDGVLEIEGRPELRGRAAITDFLTGTKESLTSRVAHPFIRHHVSSTTIDLHGPDAASAWSYFFVIAERGPDHWGRYRDHLTRADGRWLFQHRLVRVDGRAANSRRATRT